MFLFLFCHLYFKNDYKIFVNMEITKMTVKYENIAIHAGLYRANQIFLSCEANKKWSMVYVFSECYKCLCGDVHVLF